MFREGGLRVQRVHHTGHSELKPFKPFSHDISGFIIVTSHIVYLTWLEHTM